MRGEWHATSDRPATMHALKSSKSLIQQDAKSAQHHRYSENPIIDRFLEFTIGEKKSVLAVSLYQGQDCLDHVIFTLEDGTSQTLDSELNSQEFMAWWQEASEFVRHLRGMCLSPGL